MEKILFYGDEWEDFKIYSEVFGRIEQEGLEIAVSTANPYLVQLLSVGKMLVVNPATYYYDLLVYPDGDKPDLEGESMSFSEFLEVTK